MPVTYFWKRVQRGGRSVETVGWKMNPTIKSPVYVRWLLLFFRRLQQCHKLLRKSKKQKGVVDEPFIRCARRCLFQHRRLRKSDRSIPPIAEMQANTVALINIGRCYASMEKPTWQRRLTAISRRPNSSRAIISNMLLGGTVTATLPARLQQRVPLLLQSVWNNAG